MDDRMRDELLAKLAAAKTGEERAREQLRAHGPAVAEVRKTLGNPYFYSGRPADDPESETFFTGYKSHEPGLRLLRDYQDAVWERQTIERQLRDAGFEIG